MTTFERLKKHALEHGGVWMEQWEELKQYEWYSDAWYDMDQYYTGAPECGWDFVAAVVTQPECEYMLDLPVGTLRILVHTADVPMKHQAVACYLAITIREKFNI